ncbi:glycosyltransferase family 4 protein [Catenovulum maritimum]|uniref:glycosyltransferase family 4 protein n=1 Tax=Catenovulum maritimum TaxID=1513271 RepID=UPI00066172CC|nr:glycosyltransferase family 4 protein [Catenovulum maritimum]
MKLDFETQVILGNTNPKFSGVTSTMLQTSKIQKTLIKLAILGNHHVDNSIPTLTFWQAVKLCRKPLPSGLFRIYHARRNDEMIQALILKHLFGCKIKILFTSTAQRYHSKLTCFLMSKMDAVISTCTQAANYLSVPPSAIVPHGIDTKRYLPATNKAELVEKLGFNQQKLIGIFGRVRAQKGIQIFVDACLAVLKKQPGYTAIICGAWDDKALVEQLKIKIASSGLTEQIVFLGEQKFEQIPELFKACSIVMALSDNEGFGLTALEAMSCDAAVIATQAGAWPDVIEDGVDGYLIPIKDTQSAIDRLNFLIEKPSLTEKISNAAVKKIRDKYSIETEANALVNIYQQLQ